MKLHSYAQIYCNKTNIYLNKEVDYYCSSVKNRPTLSATRGKVNSYDVLCYHETWNVLYYKDLQYERQHICYPGSSLTTDSKLRRNFIFQLYAPGWLNFFSKKI